MKKPIYLLIVFILLVGVAINAQTVIIGTDSNPNNKSILDVNSFQRGVLFPKLLPFTINAYENTLGPNDVGMFLYNIATNQYMYYQSPEAGFVNLSNALIDADGDTFIKVDQTLDDDNITIQTELRTALTIENNDFGLTLFNTRNVSPNASVTPGSLLFANQLPTGSGGNDNTYFGNRDSTIEISGNQNAAFGFNTLNANTSGGANTAVGYNAMRNNTGGFNNVAVGGQAMQNNESGVSNTAVGVGSLDSLISGTGNVAIGSGSMRNLSGSNFNVGVGSGSLRNLKTGTGNVSLGDASLYNLQSGNDNVALGIDSGFGTMLRSSSQNVFIGSNAGKNNNGDGNIFLGYNAGRDFDTSNKLIISSTAASQSLIYGDLGTAKLGIFWNYNNPLPARLSVNGDVYIEDTLQLKPLNFAPTCDTDSEGKLYYNGTTNKLNLCNGSSWVPLN